MNVNGALAVSCCGEDLALFSRYGRISLNESRRDASKSFNGQGKWRDVQKKHILDFAGENARLYRCTDRNTFVGIDSFKRLDRKSVV